MTEKKIIYVDMDGVVADFIGKCNELNVTPKIGKRMPGLFASLELIPGAVDALNKLFNSGKFDLYILSTAPWSNPQALSEKLVWIKTNLPDYFYKHVIFSHHKNLNTGDYLIDDTVKHGVDKFNGIHIHFGSDKFPDWDSVTKFLLNS